MTNVLVVTPHNRLERETLQSVFTQTYAGSIDHHFTRHNPNPVPGMNIVAAYQRLRAIFLAGEWSHLWIVENDLIVPPDALEKLLAVGADMAYGVYCFRRGTPVVNIMHEETTNPMPAHDAAEWGRAFRAGAVVECAGLGFGCTLIARHVIERFEMRTTGGGGDADTNLARDVKRAGLRQAAHLGVVCGHIRPDRVTLWPAAAKPFYTKHGVAVPQLVTVRAIVSFGHWDEAGIPTIIGQGQTGQIDRELAASMAARGQLEIVGEPPVPSSFKDNGK